LNFQALSWSPSKLFRFTPDGKHQLDFPPECPLILSFNEFDFDHRLTPSYHDHLELTYIFEGKGLFTIEEKEYEVSAGDLMVISNREFHTLEASQEQTLRCISIFFLPEMIYGTGSNPIDFGYLAPFYHQNARFAHQIPASSLPFQDCLSLISKIYAEISKRSETYPLAVKTYLADLLLINARHFEMTREATSLYNERWREVERLQGVFVYLQNHYQEKIELNQIAQIACMSPSYFCRFFHKVTGLTLTNYVMRLRIDAAKTLLINSDQPVTHIAQEVGFGSHAYFDRVFRHLTHLPPNEFRKRKQSG
jgi:AraC-like DNA-binding protein